MRWISRQSVQLFLIFNLLFLAGCGGESAGPVVAPRKVAQAPQVQNQQSAVADAPVPEGGTVTVPMEYRYDPRGRRDPFRSILVMIQTNRKIGDLPPLQRIDIVDMKLTAVVWGSLGYTAMIETPDGKSYTVRAGTLLGPNHGVIKKVMTDRLRIQEKVTDIFGVTKTSDVILELNPRKEGSG